jgi:hypothetical protein
MAVDCDRVIVGCGIDVQSAMRQAIPDAKVVSAWLFGGLRPRIA